MISEQIKSPLVLSLSSRTLLTPFQLAGTGKAELIVDCSRGFSAEIFHHSQPKTSLCGQKIIGSVTKLNNWARGVTLIGASKHKNDAVEFKIKTVNSFKSKSVKLLVETVIQISVLSNAKKVFLNAEHKAKPVAVVALDHLPANPKLVIEPMEDWPTEIGAFFVGPTMYLRAEIWPLSFSNQSVKFRIKDERSLLSSEPIKLQLNAPAEPVSTLSYLIVFLSTLLFFLCSFYYVLFAVYNIDKEPAPVLVPEIAPDAVSRWNQQLLSQTKLHQTSAITQASINDQQFRDVTIDRISPLELTQITVASSDMESLSVFADFHYQLDKE